MEGAYNMEGSGQIDGFIQLRQANSDDDIKLLAGIRPSTNIQHRVWRRYKWAAWSFYLVLSALCYTDHAYNPNALCPYTDADYGAAYKIGLYITVLIKLVSLLVVMYFEANDKEYSVIFSIIFMGLTSTVVSVFGWGGVCIDRLGVPTPAAVWPEWLTLGPLLIFVTVTVVDKPRLSSHDWFFMTSFCLTLLTGFFIVFPQPRASAVFWLVVSCVTFLPLLIFPKYVKEYIDGDYHSTGPTSISVVGSSEAKQDISQDPKFKAFAVSYAKRKNMAMTLAILFSLYPATYLIGMFGYLSLPTSAVAFQLFSALSKGLYAMFAKDLYYRILADTEKVLVDEKRAFAARRAKERSQYVFWAKIKDTEAIGRPRQPEDSYGAV